MTPLLETEAQRRAWAAFQAGLAWQVERRKAFERVERIFNGAVIIIGCAVLIWLANRAAHALICYKVGCP